MSSAGVSTNRPNVPKCDVSLMLLLAPLVVDAEVGVVRLPPVNGWSEISSNTFWWQLSYDVRYGADSAAARAVSCGGRRAQHWPRRSAALHDPTPADTGDPATRTRNGGEVVRPHRAGGRADRGWAVVLRGC